MLSTDTAQARALIRAADDRDIPVLAEMGGKFLNSSHYHGFIEDNVEARAALADRMIHDASSVVLVAEVGGQAVGMLALQLYLHPMSLQPFCCEAVWWVEPEARGRVGLQLLRTGEAWATARGAKVIQMIAPTPEVERLYERKGYVAVERHYQKLL